MVFHGGTVRDEGVVRTAGGRVLYVTAVGRDLGEARRRAYRAIDLIGFEGMKFRSDIGLRQESAGAQPDAKDDAGAKSSSAGLSQQPETWKGG